MPISSPFSLPVPETPIGHLPHFSSPADPCHDDLDYIDELILNENVCISSETKGVSLFGSITDAPLDPALDEVPSSPPKRRRSEDFKAEVPLSPAIDQPSPFKKPKMVTFSNVLATAIPPFAGAFSPVYYQDLDRVEDDIFDKTILHSAEFASYSAEHEQLSEADSVMRVEIPFVDQKMPDPPWYSASRKGMGLGRGGDSQIQALLSKFRESSLRGDCRWSGNFDHAVGTWDLFVAAPSYCTTVTREQLDEGHLQRYSTNYSSSDIHMEVWKPEGMRVLDSDEEDTELEQATFDMSRTTNSGIDDLHALLLRRQYNAASLEQIRPLGWLTAVPAATVKVEACESQCKHRIETHTSRTDDNESVLKTHNQAMTKGEFSATVSLSRFMQSQTGVPPVTQLPCSNAGPSLPIDEIERSTLQPTSLCAKTRWTQPDQVAIPVPVVPRAMGASRRQFILSSSLFRRRTLMQTIEHTYPEAQLVERDFGTQLVPKGTAPSTKSDEADLLLSPLTGLILTSLQQLKQKPLPGQTNHKGVRDRISALTSRYGQLIVLVSEGHSKPAANASDKDFIQTLDQRDCDALSSLYQFARRLNTGVQSHYVPGGEVTLASWAVSCMKRYGVDDPEFTLVLDETLWETFLRKAGLNAYAAQAVLAALKKPLLDMDKTGANEQAHLFGLAAFVQMLPEERKRRFASLLGGERMLNNVSRVIDGTFGQK